jgi:hypothetical protein
LVYLIAIWYFYAILVRFSKTNLATPVGGCDRLLKKITARAELTFDEAEVVPLYLK